MKLEAGLFREQTWEPQYQPLTADLVESAISEGVLQPEEVSMLLVSSPHDPMVATAHRKLLLLRLETEGAPVQ